MTPLHRRSEGLSALVLPALAFLGFLASGAGAATFNRNEAHMKWKSSETEHFRFTYPEELEPAAEYIAGIAESVAEEKLTRYRIRLPGKVEFIVREDIFSNGWANSFQNTMTVWISDWDFPIRSTHDWLRDVVTHEFAHLVSIQSGSKLASPIQGLVLGYQDYYNERVQSSAATIIPFTHQPNWFAEGVAQYESEISGFDAWDSHRDMILRTAVLNDKLIGYDRMGSFAGTSLEYEQGPYTQGFAFVKYIVGRYGDAAMLKLWAENARMHRQTLSGSMERVLGKGGREVWEDWKNAITASYAEQVKGLGTLVQGKKLTSEGFYNYYPRWNSKGDAVYLVSNRGRDDFKGSLWRYSLADTGKAPPPDTGKAEKERLSIWAGDVRSPYSIGPDDSTVVFHSGREADENGIHKLDIWAKKAKAKQGFLGLGGDKTVRRYTQELNAAMPSFDREGKRVVFVRNKLANFQLCTAPVPETAKRRKDGKADLDPEEVKTLWPADSALEGKFGFNIYSPRFSPDGKQILFSFYDGTSRNIGLIGDDGKGYRAVLSGSHDERDPEWSPDGKSFYFSSDSGGIYNIWRCDLASGSLEPVTKVAGGAFVPAVDPAGKRLAYSGYDKDGFSLYVLDLKAPAAPTTPVAGASGDSLKPAIPAVAASALAGDSAFARGPSGPVARITRGEPAPIEPIDFGSKSEKYAGIPNRYLVNPILFGEEMSSRNRSARQGETRWLAGFNGIVNDPVLKNEIFGALLLEVGNGLDYFGANDEILSPDKESQFFLSIANHSTPVSLGASFARGNLRTDDTIIIRDETLGDQQRVENQRYAVTFRNVEASAAYDLFDASAVGEDEKTSYARLAAGYSWNHFNFYELPFGFEYYNNRYISAQLTHFGATYSDKGLVAPQGLAAVLAYTYNRSGLVRQGSFLETFVVEDGVLRANLREFDIHDLDLGLTYGTGLPWAKNGAVLVSAFAGSVLDWTYTNRDTSADTLDSFFSKGLFMRGYPYLRDVENLAFQGENVAKLSADVNQPILPDIYRGFWIFFIEDLYANVFWEAGRAWNGVLWDADLAKPSFWKMGGNPDTWYQSVGWGLKLNAKIYNNYPFLAYFEAATALSGVPDGKGGRIGLEEIRIPFGRESSINTFATRISFGVSFGLYNGLLGEKPAQNPYRNPRVGPAFR